MARAVVVPLRAAASRARRRRGASPRPPKPQPRSGMTRAQLIAESRRWLTIINAHKLNDYKRRKIVADTLDNFRFYYNRGYLEYRKAVTEGGEFAAGDLQESFFINNGTDAIEGAMKLARLYTGKPGFISTIRGFHGKSYGSLSLMGKGEYRKPFEPMLEDVFFVPYGDAGAVESELRKAEAVGHGIAGIVLEPVQGEAGAIVPPNDYWPRLREICTRYGILLIADEVQTGMGRTGKMFGVEHWDVAPDILCLGKALGGGVMPLSAFISTPLIWKVLEENPFIHTSTFGGNPLACAAGIAAVTVTLEEDLPGQAEETGDYLLGELRRLQKRFAHHWKAVRGLG